jgi:hypothetical protein
MPSKGSSQPSAGKTKPARETNRKKNKEASSTKAEIEEEDLIRSAERVAAAVNIDRVSLVNCFSHLEDSMLFPETNQKGLRIRIPYPSVEVTKREGTNQFAVKADFRLLASVQNETSSEPLIVLAAGFILVYSVGAISDFSDMELAAFAKTNGVFNAWPYWREFVQNTSARMGIPPITVPVFRF